MPGIWERVGRALRLIENQPVEDASLPQKISVHVEEIGSSGTENYSGYFYEEYLSSLTGPQISDIWDQMRRSDPKVKMVLSAVKNPIKGAHWTIQPGDSGDDYKRHAELIEQILFKDLEQTWNQQLNEILSFIEFGFSTFEIIHKVVLNHKKFGSYNSLAKLAFRSQKTIERWNLDPATGKIVTVSQYAYGDLQRLVDIPGEYLLVFTHEKEGDNYQGISGLRPCYGPWSRKNLYLKLMAIGIEKFAVPTPYMEVPEGKEASQEFLNAKLVLEKYVSHQQQYITIPQGWKLGFAQSHFDASKIREAIDKENSEMAQAFLENFLELGQSGSGSYALSYDLSDFFLMGIEHVAKSICETFNKTLIPNLVKMNFGPQESYPELSCSGIKDKPGKELAEILKILVDSKVISPDLELEKNFREKYGLPKKEEPEDRSDLNASIKIPSLSLLSEKKVSLAEKPKTPKALITQKTDELKGLMQGMLGEVGKKVIADLMAKKKRSAPSQYLKIVDQVKPQGSRDYQNDLKSFLAGLSLESIQQVKKEIPGGSKVKIAENLSSIHLADDSLFNKLPPKIQKAIEAQVGLLTAFQIQDLLKGIYFQFNNSVLSTDSDDLIESDLQESLDKYLEGASLAAGAGNTVAKSVNESRSIFFFEEGVIDEIESFTFVNGDPVSPICQDLAGTVFSKDDPNMERYSPPLHHNCKSYLVPNLKGTTKQIDPEGLQPSKASLDQYITLSESDFDFCLVSIEVSKKKATNAAEARTFALEVTSLPPDQQIEENEFIYKLPLKDFALIVEGSLKTFEPMEGVIVSYGRGKKNAEIKPTL